jgi:MtfA peptidase
MTSYVVLFVIEFTIIAVAALLMYFLPRMKTTVKELEVPYNNIKDDYNAILLQQSSYYGKLSPDEKKEFIKRVFLFLKNKEITALGNVTVGKPEKLAIAAAAIQLTFGLPPDDFPDFKKIIVHPDAFDSANDHRLHRGDTRDKGEIHLSWNYFKQGFDIPDDGINLGLHEMAHALELEELKFGTEFRVAFSAAHEKWKDLAQIAMSDMAVMQKAGFHSYAGTNVYEFFACCMEVFFEKPAAFKENLPELYNITCIMMKQDPLRNISRLKG